MDDAFRQNNFIHSAHKRNKLLIRIYGANAKMSINDNYSNFILYKYH